MWFAALSLSLILMNMYPQWVNSFCGLSMTEMCYLCLHSAESEPVGVGQMGVYVTKVRTDSSLTYPLGKSEVRMMGRPERPSGWG